MKKAAPAGSLAVTAFEEIPPRTSDGRHSNRRERDVESGPGSSRRQARPGRGQRAAGRPYVRPEDFRTETLLLYARKEDSYVYKRIVARSGVTPRCVQQVQLTEANIELVKAGLGVAILSEWAVAPHLRSRAPRAVRLTRAGHRRRVGRHPARNEQSGLRFRFHPAHGHQRPSARDRRAAQTGSSDAALEPRMSQV